MHLTSKQLEDLEVLNSRSSGELIELCKSAFDYLTNGVNLVLYEQLAEKYKSTTTVEVQKTVEALISLLIDSTKANIDAAHLQILQQELKISDEALEILVQFITSKRQFVQGSIRLANLRDYRLVHLEWRLEAILATRALLQQKKVVVTMKLYLHTESINSNRELLTPGENLEPNTERKRNRKDILVQTDVNSLVHIIQSLEQALQESRSRRNRNIVKALH